MTFRTKKLRILLTALAGTLLSGGVSMSARGPTDADIQQAADAMRAAGQSESEVQKLIQSMKDAETFVDQMEAMEATGMSEEEAARRAAGFSDKEIADMDTREADLAVLDGRIKQQNLEKDIVDFRSEHGAKPNARVQVWGETYDLKVLKCERNGETFSLRAEGEPTRHRHKGPILQANRSSAYGQGGYFETIHFTANFKDVGTATRTGTFEGSRFVFDGISETAVVGEDPVLIKVVEECS